MTTCWVIFIGAIFATAILLFFIGLWLSESSETLSVFEDHDIEE